MFEMKKVPSHVFMRKDSPKEGNLFITHRGGNNHQTPYLIFKDKGQYRLMNLHSYRANYIGDTIEELIENYFARNGNGINPVTHYFFSRRWESKIKVEDTFGWVETGFKKELPIPKGFMEMCDPKKAREILDNHIDKNNE